MGKIILLSANSADFKDGLPGAHSVEMKNFPDGENYIRIPVNVKGKGVLLIHRCYPQQDKSLVQLFLMLGSLKRQGAAKVSAAIPYFPYARQDKTFMEGEALSAETISKIINELGCEELITFDCHFIKKEGEFEYAGLRFKNLSLSSEILRYFKAKAANPLVISPDEGARYLVEKEKGSKVVKKIRGEYTDKKGIYRELKSMELGFDVKRREVVILDDMVSTGTTMVQAVKICKQKGAAKIYCGTTHGLFLVNSLQNLKVAGAEETIASDTIKSPASKISIVNKLKEFI